MTDGTAAEPWLARLAGVPHGKLCVALVVRETWHPYIAEPGTQAPRGLVVFLLTWACAAAVRWIRAGRLNVAVTMWGVVPSVRGADAPSATVAVSPPVQRFQRLYAAVVPLAPLTVALFWIVWACSQSGSAAPLPYLPIVNPLEIAQTFGLITIYVWWTRSPHARETLAPIGSMVRPVLALAAFLAANALVGRVVHFYFDVPFTIVRLGQSEVFQAGLSVLWALTALSVMSLASRRMERTMWFAGAGLLVCWS